jgi:hypothetical protein
MRKHGIDIANLLESVAFEIMGGETSASGFGGWVLDNTKANMSAIEILEDRHPEWINVGCIAHGTASAIKDFCDFHKTKGRNSLTWGVEWLHDVHRQANIIANFVNDSGPAKNIVQSHQVTIYGKKRQIATSVPTRFGSNVFVMLGIDSSEAAFKQAASDPRWSNVGGKSAEVCISQRLFPVHVLT